ncbi:HI1506-related protein [Celeribacter baekdonensis]|uniref:HI1506-related protein n=1 Tax=Celeribacter baekdonensis TaxID=875171 RepID=UPI0030D8B6F1|tara:strand:- start:14270 stop:14731 length:462 start_codon:yes stop_codon:yes gene_type:complete
MARKTTSIIKPETAASKDATDIKTADDVKVAATGEDATNVAADATTSADDAGNANEQAKPSNTDAVTDAEKEADKVTDTGINGDQADKEAQSDDKAIPSEPHLTVVCHRQDGRRRCGRRWPHGETIVPEADLTVLQIAQLEADPHFTLTKRAD